MSRIVIVILIYHRQKPTELRQYIYLRIFCTVERSSFSSFSWLHTSVSSNGLGGRSKPIVRNQIAMTYINETPVD
jgi:hypothetical protein